MPGRIPQSATIRAPLQAYLASDHISPATGVTIAITISKNGAAYGNPSAGATNATEIGSGSYYVDLSGTDTGSTGPLFIKGTSATIDNVIQSYDVVAATNAGFTALPAVAASAVGGLLTAPTTANVGLADLSRILGTALTETAGLLAGGFKKLFNVASPTGTLNSIPDAVAGATGGLFIAGTNAATTVTTALTTTFTGNLTGSVASVTARVSANTDQLAGQTVTAAAGVTFPGSVASPTNITAGTITTVTNLTNAATAGDLTAAMKASVTAAVPTATANADALLDRDMSVGTDSGTTTFRTARQALRFLRNKWSITGAALTVFKEDDATASWTGTVSTDAAAIPIIGNDPAG